MFYRHDLLNIHLKKFSMERSLYWYYLNLPLTTVPCNNLTQCSCCPCNKWPWSSCCPCTSCSNVHVLPVTSDPKTRVVRPQVDPNFMSSAHNWAVDYVVRNQVAPILLDSRNPRLKFRVNLSTDNIIKKHLHTVNLRTVNLCADYLSRKKNQHSNNLRLW